MRAFVCGFATITVLLLAPALQAGQLTAQDNRLQTRHASPLLRPDHWAVQAAERAEALDLARGFLPAQRAVPRHVIGEVLREAHRAAIARAPQLAELTAGWVARFEAEFGGAGIQAGESLVSLGHALGAAFRAEEGGVAVGVGVFPHDRTGARPLEDEAQAELSGAAAFGLSPFAALQVEPVLQGSELDVRSAEVVLGWNPVALSVGRGPVGYGYGSQGNGIVLSGTLPLDRVQLETTRPIGLPSVLRYLGRFSFHGFVSRLEEPRHPGDPYMWGMAGSLQPHSRITISIHRAAILGGDSVETPLTPRTFFRSFRGHNLLGFENEVVSAHLRLRLPTDRFVPITLYGEWGAEDAAGAWRDVPGRVAGIVVPALPAFPAGHLGAEYASFAGSCCGNPPWYRHAPHTGGWADRDRPLGHVLGGEGRQLTVFGGADLVQQAIRIDGQLFSRRRSGENLFVPGREGTSTRISLRAAWRPRARLELDVAGARESGAGWSENTLRVGANAYF